MSFFKNSNENISCTYEGLGFDDIENELEKLKKRYQDNPDNFINDYDEMIKDILIGIMANFNINQFIRNDVIASAISLIDIREFVINHCRDNSSSNNQG